jgi:WD40 repeat protein
MAGSEYLTRAGRLYDLCTALVYGPGTWFDACRDAATAGPGEVADLLARLRPGHEVARALSTRSSWPGQSRLPGAAASLATPETGAALSAARAAAEVAAVLAGLTSSEERLQVAMGHWRRANILPRVSMTGADISVGPADAQLAAVVRRLGVVTDDLGPGDAAAAGLVTLVARALRAAFPAVAREVELPVLFDKRSTGGHGFLRISCMTEGPPGLYPDPRVMLFLVADPLFAQALDAAWRTVPGRLARRCLVWRLTADGQPCDEVEGGSLGGAFGVGLAELARTVPPLGRLRPRRLDRRCAVTAGLGPTGGFLEAGGLRNKLEEAVRQRWRVVLAAPPGDDKSAPGRLATTLLREASVQYAADLPTAVRLARTRVNTAFVITVVAVTVAAAGIAGGVVSAELTTDAARLQSIGNRLVRNAASIQSSDPADSLLLDSLAAGLGAPGARAALVKSLLSTHYAGALPGGTGLCGGSQTWSPDGRTVATAGPASIRLWDTRQRTVERTLNTAGRVTGCAFAPDGATLSAARGGKLLLFALDARSGAAPVTFTAGAPVQQMHFAPDGVLAAVSPDGSVWLWRIASHGPAAPTARLLGRVPNATASDATGAGMRPLLAFSPDSRTLAVGGPAEAVVVDVSDPGASHVVGSIPGTVGSVVFSPDGGTLAVGRDDGTTALWDVRGGTRPRLRALIEPKQRLGQVVGSVAFTPDGNDLITAGGGLGEVWDVSGSGPPVFAHDLTTGPNEVSEADLAPDGNTAAVEDAAGLLTLWTIGNRATPRAFATLPLGRAAVTGLAFAAVRIPALVVTTYGGGVSLWNLADPTRPRQVRAVGPAAGRGVPAGGFDPQPAVFSADGRRLATAQSGGVGLWDINVDGRISRVGTIQARAGGMVIPAAMSADGAVLAVGTGSGKVPLALWGVRGRPRLLGHLPKGSTTSRPGGVLAAAAFSSDSRALVTVSDDRSATWWNVTDPADPVQMARRSVDGKGAPGTVAYTSDGRLAAATQAGTPGVVWDVSHPTPAQLSNRPGLEGGLAGDAVFDGHSLVVGVLGAVSVWDLTDPTDPTQLADFPSGGTGPFTGRLALSRSGTLATAQLADVPSAYHTGFGVVRLWDLSPILDVISDPVAVACRIDDKRLSAQMWQRFAPDLPYQPICR